jgi:spoIIIJ-associated protein
MEIVNKILAATGTQTITTLKSAHDQDAGGPSIDITGEDSGLLIGRRGETLRALQFLVNLIVRNHLKEDAVRVVLDVERYKERRNNSLTDMALRVADKVVGTGRAVSLEPMPPAERRVVHMALADHPRVSTESSGLGDSRKVVIAPKTE